MSNITDYKKFIETFWERTLGVKPEQEFTPKMAESKCYKCESKNVKSLVASCWTGKLKCDDCGYYTYIVHADFMGGALNEDVAISKQDCKI